jgi:hypothetical protein
MARVGQAGLKREERSNFIVERAKKTGEGKKCFSNKIKS